MKRLSLWWIFVVLFGMTIGGIHTLRWWAAPAPAPRHAAPSKTGGGSTTAALRHQNHEPKHWRALFMQQ